MTAGHCGHIRGTHMCTVNGQGGGGPGPALPQLAQHLPAPVIQLPALLPCSTHTFTAGWWVLHPPEPLADGFEQRGAPGLVSHQQHLAPRAAQEGECVGCFCQSRDVLAGQQACGSGKGVGGWVGVVPACAPLGVSLGMPHPSMHQWVCHWVHHWVRHTLACALLGAYLWLH